MPDFSGTPFPMEYCGSLFNALGQVFAMTQKVFMVIARGILAAGNAIKAIQVELPLKGTEFA